MATICRWLLVVGLFIAAGASYPWESDFKKTEHLIYTAPGERFKEENAMGATANALELMRVDLRRMQSIIMLLGAFLLAFIEDRTPEVATEDH